MGGGIPDALRPIRLRLASGLGASLESYPEGFKVEPECDDRSLARTLVATYTAAMVGAIEVGEARPTEAESRPPDQVIDGSILQRGEAPRDVLAEIDDARTLLAMMRGGDIWQRRSATLKLSHALTHNSVRPEAALREVVAALEDCRDVEIAYELQQARIHLPGAAGRRARAEMDEWRTWARELAAQVIAFWDGEGDSEPLLGLPGDRRAQLLLRLRDLPEVLVRHVGALIEGSDGDSSREARLRLISALRYAGDRRLLPELVTSLDSGDAELAIEAARALSFIDDPRARPALKRAFERAVVESHRVVLAGALGRLGDARGQSLVRRSLGSDDPVVLRYAIEAIATLGSIEDNERIATCLDHGDFDVLEAAIHALGRMGSSQAYARLLAGVDGGPGLLVEIEEAIVAIRARMELRGEAVPGEATMATALAAAQSASLATTGSTPLRTRMRARFDLWVGRFWAAMGSTDSAVARFEAAAARRSGWVMPLVALGVMHARSGENGSALVAFRRALELDRRRIELHAPTMRAVLTCFLRRAEEIRREGRDDIAQALLDEVARLDIRRAPASLRYELGLQRDEGRRSG